MCVYIGWYRFISPGILYKEKSAMVKFPRTGSLRKHTFPKAESIRGSAFPDTQASNQQLIHHPGTR